MILKMFLNELTYAHQCFTYSIKNTEKTVIMWNITTIQFFEYMLKCYLFLW